MGSSTVDPVDKIFFYIAFTPFFVGLGLGLFYPGKELALYVIAGGLLWIIFIAIIKNLLLGEGGGFPPGPID